MFLLAMNVIVIGLPTTYCCMIYVTKSYGFNAATASAYIVHNIILLSFEDLSEYTKLIK